MPHLIAVGEIMLDLRAPSLEPGRAVHAPLELRPGGSPVNAALAAAAAGARATVIGRVGDDPAGRLVRDALAAAGVEPLLAVDAEAPTGTFLEAGDAIAADRGAGARLLPEDMPDRLAADAVLVSSYAPSAAANAAVERADAPWVAARVEGANALLLDAGEARELTGAAPEEAVALLAEGRRLVAVTLGPDGALASLDGDTARARPPFRRGGSTTGAGDAFAAILLLALVRGLPLADALDQACAAGAGRIV